MILKADIDQRAKDVGLTPSQVTPTIRVALMANMIAEASVLTAASLIGATAFGEPPPPSTAVSQG